MSTSAKAVMDQALKLPANDRAALVETLISSLDKPDPALLSFTYPRDIKTALPASRMP